MELCKVTAIPGKNAVQCITHSTVHTAKAAVMAVEDSAKAEKLRRQWDKYYGYTPAAPNTVRIETKLTTQSRPSRTEQPWELTLRNFRNEDLLLYYCDENGQEKLFDTLPASSETILQSPDGAAWALRDTQQQLMRIIDPVSNAGIMIEVA